ncbi:hypothetical protein DSL72_006258 [Monilinia vaccinii-corymbosi]|uniref:SMP-30/Gluconolactonase/LRE-like region domain-containing protein n=1 Tax=Monilinia vaccinii-corymbosi TaxID=61207 RepID=A0A8A3PLS7_9HELO|nr:hypothetical protein DSL72_006258 [Monilinia vaccinii-corymbosi]
MGMLIINYDEERNCMMWKAEKKIIARKVPAKSLIISEDGILSLVGRKEFYAIGKLEDLPGIVEYEKTGIPDIKIGTTDLAVPIQFCFNVQDDPETVLIAREHGFSLVVDYRKESFSIRNLADLSLCLTGYAGEYLPDCIYTGGIVDSKGRLWMTLIDGSGELERLEESQGYLCVVESIDGNWKLTHIKAEECPFGAICLSLDEKTMYTSNFRLTKIMAWDFDINACTLSNQRVFMQLENFVEWPMALVMDTEQHIWCAVFNGQKIIRIDPQGKIVGVVYLSSVEPVAFEFFGHDLIILTTAGLEDLDMSPNPGVITPEELSYKGHVYRVRVGYTGKPKRSYKHVESASGSGSRSRSASGSASGSVLGSAAESN